MSLRRLALLGFLSLTLLSTPAEAHWIWKCVQTAGKAILTKCTKKADNVAGSCSSVAKCTVKECAENASNLNKYIDEGVEFTVDTPKTVLMDMVRGPQVRGCDGFMNDVDPELAEQMAEWLYKGGKK